MAYLYQVVASDIDSDIAWPLGRREVVRLEDALQALLRQGLRDAARVAGKPEIDPAPHLAEFLTLYPRRPLRQNKGGSGLNDSLWLFLLARLLGPKRIIESGTWRGHSAWLFRQACPGAEIASFDIEVPAEGRHQEPDVAYHLTDWSENPANAVGTPDDLIFFDDHVSHARRIREAAERGFRLALFDDNFAAHELHATGAPPVPTLAMLTDPNLPPGGVIEWQRNGKHYRYDDNLSERRSAESMVEDWTILPELASVTRHSPGSRLTLTRLRARIGS